MNNKESKRLAVWREDREVIFCELSSDDVAPYSPEVKKLFHSLQTISKNALIMQSVTIANKAIKTMMQKKAS